MYVLCINLIRSASPQKPRQEHVARVQNTPPPKPDLKINELSARIRRIMYGQNRLYLFRVADAAFLKSDLTPFPEMGWHSHFGVFFPRGFERGLLYLHLVEGVGLRERIYDLIIT